MFRKLKADIDCILERDPAARSRWEVLTCYPGLHAIYVQKLAHWFWKNGLRWLGRFTSHLGRFLSPASRSIPARRSARAYSSTTAWAW